MPVLPRGNSPACDKQDPKQDAPQDNPPPPNTSPGDHTPPITPTDRIVPPGADPSNPTLATQQH